MLATSVSVHIIWKIATPIFRIELVVREVIGYQCQKKRHITPGRQLLHKSPGHIQSILVGFPLLCGEMHMNEYTTASFESCHVKQGLEQAALVLQQYHRSLSISLNSNSNLIARSSRQPQNCTFTL